MVARTPSSPATTILAVIGCAAAFTWLGPVLRPFLLAVFVFYAVQSAAKGLERLGLGLTAAYITLISSAGIVAILLGQLVYRESGVFLEKWPKYEQRIETLLDTWPVLGGIRPAPAAPAEKPVAAERRDARLEPAVGAGVPEANRGPGQRGAEGTAAPSLPVVPGPLPGAEERSTQAAAGPSATAEPPAREKAPADAEAPTHETPPGDATTTGAPEDGAPEDGAPEDGAPEDGAPEDGAKRASPPLPGQPRSRSLLKDFVAGGAKDLVDYVFRHSLDTAELLILVLVYTIFLSLGRHQLQARVVRAFPGEQGRRLLAIGAGIGRSMETFMTVKTLVGAGMAASAAALMLWFRVDHWLLWTCLFFAANYVTYIGSMAACVPPIVIAFLDLPSPATASAVALCLIVNRLVWIDFVEVRLAGRELSLDPVIVFLWLAFWGWVWGVLGLLLAYPMLATLKIVLSQVEGWEGWAVMLGDR